MLLKGRKAIVTGAGAGIGRCVAIAYGEEGADVFVCDINEDNACAVAQEIKALGVNAYAFGCDVSDPDACQRAVDKAVEQMGRIDILANVAGISPKNPGGMKISFLEMSIETWRKVLEVNLSSMFYMSRLVAKHMVEQKYGRIINMSSVAGLTGSEHSPAAICYSASKAGVAAITRSMAYELAEYNITVNAAAPGRIATSMAAANNSIYNDRNLKDIPAKRFGMPEEVADLFVFYASDKCSYINGETTLVTGGWYMR